MKFIIFILCSVALIGAIQAQLVANLDTTRARLLHGWVGSGGPTPIDVTIYNDLGNSVFEDTVYPGASSRWVYLGSLSAFTFGNNLGFDLPYQSIDARVATYVLYGSNASNPNIDVWADSTDKPPRGKARIRFSSTVAEDFTIVIGSSSKQLSSGSDIKAYVEFDVDPGLIQISTQDNRFTSSHSVDADVTYRAIHVMQEGNDVVLLAVTCDYSVTGRWNIVSLLNSDATVIRGGVAESTQTLVMANGATKYREYIPGNAEVQIQPLQGSINYLVRIFMAGFEEMTMVIGAGISLNIDYIPQPKNNKALVVFKNDWTSATVSTLEGSVLIPNLVVGWSSYIEIEPGSTSGFSMGPMTKVSVNLEANNVYIIAFNENNIVTMVQAETGAPYNLRHIHATATCQNPTSLFFSNTSSPIISSVEYGTASAYTSTVTWAGYYKYVVKDQDGKYIGAAAFRSEPNKNYSLITIGKCDVTAVPPVKVFYWQDDNTLPEEGMARVKALHGSYDTSPSNPILQINGTVSLEQMTFGYFSPSYKDIPGGMKHLINVSFDNTREFNKTVYIGNQTVATIVTAGSWADDTFDIFVFADVGTLQEPSNESPNRAPIATPAKNNNAPKSSTSTATGSSNSLSAIILMALIAVLALLCVY